MHALLSLILPFRPLQRQLASAGRLLLILLNILFSNIFLKNNQKNYNKELERMLGLMESQSVLLWNSLPIPLKPATTISTSFAPALTPRRRLTTSASAISSELTSKPETSKSIPATSSAKSFVSTTPLIHAVKNLGFRPTPKLGLLSLLFSLSMAFGRLGVSMKKLSKVASEEVPGTLSSLKLSSMEVNDLAQELRNLRHEISGIRTVENDRDTKDARSFRNKDSIS
ncbi:uncharacterized protein LOC114718744 isoform X1 [Neltuma alba]|uniref:uncharacterized protein LOC114718744 isoform X1 n=1 Tax=Neltuma alba TaxID=207710 RepID=UPI0010A3A2AB|nr:uncharacterized protein LOC114718744 isoform X1 [Prosopis alba]